LMDILMPVMDGFEATRMIREKERLVGDGRTPIIALTSYSLKAIHEKCIAVGMDNYLHKPVSAQDLATLLRAVLQSSTVNNSTGNAQETGKPALIDIQGTLDNLDNNSDLYREMVSLFIAMFPSAHQDLVAAISSGSIETLLPCAHKIKGMSANVGAIRYADLVSRIEDAALQGNIGDPAQWLNPLSTEFHQLQDAMAAINWHDLR